MNTSFKYKWILVGLFSVFAILMEMVTFAMLGFGALPTYFLLDIGVILILDALFFAIPNNKVVLALSTILLLGQGVISYINITMYDVYGDLFTLQFINLTHEAIQAIGPNMLNIGKGFILLMLVLFHFLLCLGLLIRHGDSRKYHTKEFLKKFGTAVLAFSIVGNATLHLQINALKENASYYYTQDMKYRYSQLNIKSESFRNFGTFGYYFKEFKNIYLTRGKLDELTLQNIVSEIKKDSNNTNAYTGFLEGKNVITIMMESVQWYAINEELTPNLYRIMTQGIDFSNNYSRNKTNMSEFIGMTGAYPTTQQISGNNKYYLPYSLANILKEEGYITSYIHENEGSYYSRSKVMPQVGFDITKFYEDYYPNSKLEWGNWEGDSQFVARAINDLVPSATEKFYTFYTSLTTHGPYQDAKAAHMIELTHELGYHDQIEACTTWINYLEGTGYEENYKQYQAEVMDLDVAVGEILAKVEEYGILDNTVFVLYGDHQVYYDQIYMYVNHNELNDFSHSKLYRTPLYIYNPSLTTKYKSLNSGSSEYTRFTSTYNIVPTMLDLLGVDYYSALYPGTSAFYDEDDYMQKNVFVSLQGGIFTDKIFTLNGVDLKDSEVEDYESYLADLRIAANHFFKKFDYIEKVINNDVFKYVDYKTLKIKK